MARQCSMLLEHNKQNMPHPKRQIRNNDRFQLKLTQQWFGDSQALSIRHNHLESSLGYTDSISSILMDETELAENQIKGVSEEKEKESSTKATTLFRDSNDSILARINSKNSVNCKRDHQKPKTSSLHQISLKKRPISMNLPLVYARPQQKNIIPSLNSKRSTSCKIYHKALANRSNPKKPRAEAIYQEENIKLANWRTEELLKVKGVKLERDERKGMVYIRKIIQNRVNMFNPFQSQLELPTIKTGQRSHLPR